MGKDDEFRTVLSLLNIYLSQIKSICQWLQLTKPELHELITIKFIGPKKLILLYMYTYTRIRIKNMCVYVYVFDWKYQNTQNLI